MPPSGWAIHWIEERFRTPKMVRTSSITLLSLVPIACRICTPALGESVRSSLDKRSWMVTRFNDRGSRHFKVDFVAVFSVFRTRSDFFSTNCEALENCETMSLGGATIMEQLLGKLGKSTSPIWNRPGRKMATKCFRCALVYKYCTHPAGIALPSRWCFWFLVLLFSTANVLPRYL